MTAGGISAAQLADAANSSTYCVCFFGGDPASQMPNALAAAGQLAKNGVVICWETAGTSHPKLLDRAVHLSLQTGGCIKFDLKAWDETLHIVLTGESNRRTLENFVRAVRGGCRFGRWLSLRPGRQLRPLAHAVPRSEAGPTYKNVGRRPAF